MKTIVVGFSGGVTSAWCAGWAKRTFPNDRIVLLWHDTKEEDPDTYRFLREMAAKLELPITERSDGRSVTEIFRDEGFLGNNQNAMCSRIAKREPGERYGATRSPPDQQPASHRCATLGSSTCGRGACHDRLDRPYRAREGQEGA